MTSEVIAALAGTGVGGVIAWVLQWLQNREAEKNWHRNNQRDIDWRAEDFVIEAHAFSRKSDIMVEEEQANVFDSLEVVTRSTFDYDRANLLATKAEAYEGRMSDPDLRWYMKQIKEDLQRANYNGRFFDGKEATTHRNSRAFYRRIAELYGDKPKTPMPMEVELPPQKITAEES